MVRRDRLRPVAVGGVQGRDSVPALLEPGELVLPKPITEFMRRAFTEGPSEGGAFQEGGLVGARAGALTIGELTIENVSDVRYIDILLDRLNERVLFGGGRLIASEVAP